jgi:hypothetical protein
LLSLGPSLDRKERAGSIHLYRSSVRLLETSTGTFTSEFLGLASSGVGDKEGLVVLDEELLELALLALVSEFLVEGDETLADSLTDGHNLGSGTSTSDADSHVHVLEALSSEEEDGLVNLHSHGLGFDELKSLSVNADETLAVSDASDSGCVLLSAKALDHLILFRHFFL